MSFDDFFEDFDLGDDFNINPEDLSPSTNEAWDTGIEPDIFGTGEEADIFSTKD